MIPFSYHLPEDRSVIVISGEDKTSFLQGLITNDTQKISPTQAIYSALLNAQGRFLFDFFIAEHQGAYLIDCEANRKADLLRLLALYRLRAKVTLSDGQPNWCVCLLYGEELEKKLPGFAEGNLGAAIPMAGGVSFLDPRLKELGVRAFLPATQTKEILAPLQARPSDGLDYDRLRIQLGVPISPIDLVPEKSLLLESGMDLLHAIDWEKGCYVGQEVTARSKYRSLVRKRIFPVKISGPLPNLGAPIILAGQEVGEMRSITKDSSIGLALLRLEVFTTTPSPALSCDGATLIPFKAPWMPDSFTQTSS